MGEAARQIQAPSTAVGLRVLAECEPAIKGTALRRLRAVPEPQAPRSTTDSAPAFRTAPAPARLRTLLRMVVEVLDGRRPAEQLRDLTSAPCYDRIRASVPDPRRCHSGAVHSVHSCVPDAGVVEACATVRYGDRARALVLRIEALQRPGRTGTHWCCTEFRLL